MVITTHSAVEPPPIADVVFLLEATSRLEAVFPELRANYIMPILQHFNPAISDDSDTGIDYNCNLYTLVTFNTVESAPAASTRCTQPTKNTHDLLDAFNYVVYSGCSSSATSHITEGLATCLQVFDDCTRIRSELELVSERHVVLVCNSVPYDVSSRDCMRYNGLMAGDLANIFAERNIHLTVISPRRHPKLFQLYKIVKKPSLPLPNYAVDPRHHILPDGILLKEKPKVEKVEKRVIEISNSPKSVEASDTSQPPPAKKSILEGQLRELNRTSAAASAASATAPPSVQTSALTDLLSEPASSTPVIISSATTSVSAAVQSHSSMIRTSAPSTFSNPMQQQNAPVSGAYQQQMPPAMSLTGNQPKPSSSGQLIRAKTMQQGMLGQGNTMMSQPRVSTTYLSSGNMTRTSMAQSNSVQHAGLQSQQRAQTMQSQLMGRNAPIGQPLEQMHSMPKPQQMPLSQQIPQQIPQPQQISQPQQIPQPQQILQSQQISQLQQIPQSQQIPPHRMQQISQSQRIPQPQPNPSFSKVGQTQQNQMLQHQHPQLTQQQLTQQQPSQQLQQAKPHVIWSGILEINDKNQGNQEPIALQAQLVANPSDTDLIGLGWEDRVPVSIMPMGVLTASNGKCVALLQDAYKLTVLADRSPGSRYWDFVNLLSEKTAGSDSKAAFIFCNGSIMVLLISKGQGTNSNFLRALYPKQQNEFIAGIKQGVNVFRAEKMKQQQQQSMARMAQQPSPIMGGVPMNNQSRIQQQMQMGQGQRMMTHPNLSRQAMISQQKERQPSQQPMNVPTDDDWPGNTKMIRARQQPQAGMVGQQSSNQQMNINQQMQNSASLNMGMNQQMQQGLGQPNMGQPNMGQQSMGQPNMGQQSMGQPNMGQQGMGQQGMGQQNMGQQNMSQQNMGQPTIGQTNLGQSNIGQQNMSQQSMGQQRASLMTQQRMMSQQSMMSNQQQGNPVMMMQTQTGNQPRMMAGNQQPIQMMPQQQQGQQAMMGASSLDELQGLFK